MNWVHETPTKGYDRGERCLGMLISDRTDLSLQEIERRILTLFPERTNAPRPLLPLFNCCGSSVIPSFNNHPDTTEDDITRVMEGKS